MSAGTKAVIVILLAGLAWYLADSKPEPTPAPLQTDIPLRGLFETDRAAEDAQALAALCYAIAHQIEVDGRKEEPLLDTGIAVDELRTRTRDLMLDGESLGSRQPKVRQAIGEYLTKELTTDGGPISPAQRAVWVQCYREIARSCEDAAR